jgi:hypothetical protein
MRALKTVVPVIIWLTTVTQVYSQITSATATIRHLDSTKPTVYISFAHSSTKNGAIVQWLRLNNNSDVSIEVSTYSGYETSSGDTAIVPMYEVRSSGRWEWKKGKARWTDGPKPPQVDVPYDLIDEYVLGPGQSVLFNVPDAHLASELSVSLRYIYPWEKGRRNEPEHRVAFDASQVPNVAARASQSK